MATMSNTMGLAPVVVGDRPPALWTEGRRVNLGAGMDLTEGFLRLDIAGQPDLMGDVRYLPFRSESFEEARAYHIIEHLPREELIGMMNEWWRILIVGGILDLEFPIAPSDVAFADPTHRAFYVPGTMEYFIAGGRHEEHRILYHIHPWKRIRQERIGHNDILGVTLEKLS